MSNIHDNNIQFPVAIFGLAYGEDADLQLLTNISRITGGLVMKGNADNIHNI